MNRTLAKTGIGSVFSRAGTVKVTVALSVASALVCSAALLHAQVVPPNHTLIEPTPHRSFPGGAVSDLKVVFGTWLYPQIINAGGGGMGGRIAMWRCMTADSVDKVWAYYADKAPLVNAREGTNSQVVPWNLAGGGVFSTDKNNILSALSVPAEPKSLGTLTIQQKGETLFVIVRPASSPEAAQLGAKTEVDLTIIKDEPAK